MFQMFGKKSKITGALYIVQYGEREREEDRASLGLNCGPAVS